MSFRIQPPRGRVTVRPVTPAIAQGDGTGLTVLALGVLGAVVVGAGVAIASPGDRVILPLIFAVVSLSAVYLCVRVRPLRWMDPLVWMVLPLALEFVARPLAVLADKQYTYKNYFVLPSYTKVSEIGLAGLLALCAGYCAGAPAALGRRLPPVPADVDEDRISSLAVRFGVVGLAVYGFAAVKSGLSPAALISTGLPVKAAGTAYFGLTPELGVPVCVLLLRQGLIRRSRRRIVTSVVLAILIALIYASSGGRFNTLFFVGGMTLYPMLHYDWRPPRWIVVAGIAITLIFVAGTAGLSGRTSESVVSALRTAALAPAKSIEKIALGPTLEMFDGMAVETQLVPAQVGYHPFTSLTSVLAEPVPRSLWRGKPYYPEGNLDAAAFADAGIAKGANSVAFSILGGFYYDSGLIGVIVGLALVGALLRLLSEYVAHYRTNQFVLLVLAVSLPLVVVLARGNFGDTLSRSLFIVVPIPLIAWLARNRARSPSSPASARPPR